MPASAAADAAEIAASLEADPRLLPYLAYLLQDLGSLGCDPELIVALARRAGTNPSSQVLDLCCGKGAASIALASSLRCRVHGVDLFPAMVEAARAAAAAAGVSELCRFEVGNVRERLPELRGYDGVLISAAGSVLGGFRDTVAALRSAVRPGGWMLIEDGFVPDGYSGSLPEGYEYYLPHAEVLRELTAFGDTLVEEVLESDEVERQLNSRNTAAIRRRAEELAARDPERSALFLEFAESQLQWSAASESMQSAAWLLRKVEVSRTPSG